MVSKLRKAGIEEPEKKHTVHYTRNEELNELLNYFVDQGRAENIWFSIEAEDLFGSSRQSLIKDTIYMTLTQATRCCIKTTTPRNRYIKLRCRAVQNKIFIKILYSCEERQILYVDNLFLAQKEAVERVGGYMKQELENDVGVIKIAIPDLN